MNYEAILLLLLKGRSNNDSCPCTHLYLAMLGPLNAAVIM